jgi:hypothetical protein
MMGVEYPVSTLQDVVEVSSTFTPSPNQRTAAGWGPIRDVSMATSASASATTQRGACASAGHDSHGPQRNARKRHPFSNQSTRRRGFVGQQPASRARGAVRMRMSVSPICLFQQCSRCSRRGNMKPNLQCSRIKTFLTKNYFELSSSSVSQSSAGHWNVSMAMRPSSARTAAASLASSSSSV